jgi:hypothetical protein
VIASYVEGGVGELLVEGQGLVFDDLVVEEQGGVGLQGRVQGKLLGEEDADIVLDDFGKGGVDLLLLLDGEEGLVDVGLEDVDQSLLELLIEVFDGLDVDQRGGDDASHFEGVDGCELGDHGV